MEEVTETLTAAALQHAGRCTPTPGRCSRLRLSLTTFPCAGKSQEGGFWGVRHPCSPRADPRSNGAAEQLLGRAPLAAVPLLGPRSHRDPPTYRVFHTPK